MIGYGSGLLTRRYHGLLMAALHPPLGHTLLFSKLDEVASYGSEDYPLFTNRWADGTVEPRGYQVIERFHLEGSIPVWSYGFGDALLEKRIWMQQGENRLISLYPAPVQFADYFDDERVCDLSRSPSYHPRK